MDITVATKSVPREQKREEILERFRVENPDLAAALQLAGETDAVFRSFEQSREAVTYSVTDGTIAS